MDPLMRLRRVTDLFEEGRVVYLGSDQDGPVLVWVNKLNSFEVEEVRRDASVRRGERLAELGKPDSPERMGAEAEIGLMSDDDLRKAVVENGRDERYLTVLDDIETDEEWRERLERIRRGPSLHDEEGLEPDHPRRQQLAEDQRAYMTEIERRQDKAAREALEDLARTDRAELVKKYVEDWRQRITLNEFMEAKRQAEMFYSMRQCQARETGLDEQVGGRRWDHSECDHSLRWVEERAHVRRLPERVIERVIEAIDEIRVNARDAGNSDAPPSSSGSSEPSSQPEALSTPSSPDETPVAAPTS